ncbi:MAG: N-acetylmuramoyl-L-alanine amidase [Lachnospiraceae bacterium]|nr:N-acetylmuramoyl-L-alanine amidase [Lachnospiraceae bacterium]
MKMSNLTRIVILSPNKSARKAKIDTVTIHCMACNASVVALGNHFAQKKTKASSNYGIGSDGMIACYVPEDYRSWATSSASNDQRAVTIEVANDGRGPDWHVSREAVNALIELLVDICRRNGIPELLWKADKVLIGQPDKQNMTVHRWFANKACPGDYLYNLHGSIAAEVNRRLKGEVAPVQQTVMKAARPTIKRGAKGAGALLLQQNLNTFGCGLAEDGSFGSASVAALKAWQGRYGLQVDGSYGPKSYAKMKELIEG